SGRRQLCGCVFIEFEADNLVSCKTQTFRHVEAHLAESNDSQFHVVCPSLFLSVSVIQICPLARFKQTQPLFTNLSCNEEVHSPSGKSAPRATCSHAAISFSQFVTLLRSRCRALAPSSKR